MEDREHEPFEGGSSRPGPHNAAHSGVQKRRAVVAPGYLHDLLQARQKMKSMGVSAKGGALLLVPAKGGAGGSGGGASAAALRQVPYIPVKTLPLLFAQRSKHLQRSKQHTPQPYQRCPGEPVGLLSLPEDVLLKILCHLRHNEIKPLFLVCKNLRDTLKEAVHFHFNFSTPFRPGHEGAGPGEPRPDRNNKKRAVTNLAAVMGQLQRGPRLAAAKARGNAPPVMHAAPRALSFKDSQPGPS